MLIEEVFWEEYCIHKHIQILNNTPTKHALNIVKKRIVHI